MEVTSQSVSALTSLIEVNNKRVNVYRTLAEKTAKKELKALFNHYAEQSRSFSGSLSTWRAAYGGFGYREERSGSFNVWTQLKSLLNIGGARNPVVLCQQVEEDALRAYRTAIENSLLPTATVVDVQKQTRELERVIAKLQSIAEY
jgi:uncharacterized protein (TIGR02284 family)